MYKESFLDPQGRRCGNGLFLVGVILDLAGKKIRWGSQGLRRLLSLRILFSAISKLSMMSLLKKRDGTRTVSFC